MKRILSFTLALIMALTVLPMSLLATEVTATEGTVPEVVEPTTDDLPAEVEVYYQTVTHENPLYYSEPVITSVTEYHYSTLYLANFNFDDYITEAEAIEEITDHLEDRETAFTVYVKVDAYYDSLTADLFYAAIEHTGRPDEGDYIKYQYGGFGAAVGYFIYGATYVQIDYTVSYYANEAQEEAVDDKVDVILASLNLNGKSDYEKIKAIYDYICLNVVYDNDNLDDPTYLLKHSAHAAFINNKAVCQGYALMFYRLALELGIDCRIVTGYSNNQNHAWNIVKLNGKYYNVDATWDAEYLRVRGEYNYFLKSDADFEDHARDEEHSSESFYAAYPMHTESYDVNNAVNIIASGTCGTNLTWVLTDDGTLTISGTGAMKDYYLSSTPWNKYRTSIKSVIIEDGVTNIGRAAFSSCTSLTSVIIGNRVTSIDLGAFYGCLSLTSITIPGNVTKIGANAFESCISLTDVVIQEGVESIGELAFYNCSELRRITIPSSVTSIGSRAFEYGGPDAVYITDISSWCNITFANAASNPMFELAGLYLDGELVTDLVIPEGVKYIRNYAFFGCEGLTSVTIPASAEYVGDTVFGDCYDLEKIYFLSSDTAIGNIIVLLKTVIYGYDDSTAEDYADRRGSEFVAFCDGDHDFGDWEKLDNDDHIRYCEGFDLTKMEMCPAIETNPHDWDDGVQEDEHTVVYTCSECRAVYRQKDVESGDMSGDGSVDKNDAIYLLYSVLFGEDTYPLNQSCDFNGDGSVDKNDAIYLLYHALFGAVSYPLN